MSNKAKYFCNCGSKSDKISRKVVDGVTVAVVHRCRATRHEFMIDVKTGEHSIYTPFVPLDTEEAERRKKASMAAFRERQRQASGKPVRQSAKERAENARLNPNRGQFARGNKPSDQSVRTHHAIVSSGRSADPMPIASQWHIKQAEARRKIEDRRYERDLAGVDLW